MGKELYNYFLVAEEITKKVEMNFYVSNIVLP